MRISRAYLRISDHLRVTVRIRVGTMVSFRVWVRVMDRVRVADCCIQTAGESDKMSIIHVTETDQWRAAPQIRPLRILSCPTSCLHLSNISYT